MVSKFPEGSNRTNDLRRPTCRATSLSSQHTALLLHAMPPLSNPGPSAQRPEARSWAAFSGFRVVLDSSCRAGQG